MTVTRREYDVDVSVRDNEIGIPGEMLSRVFDMFAQVNDPLRSRQDGLGIGLNIVRTLVQMHGGSVQGSQRRVRKRERIYSVIVQLPLAAMETASQERQMAAPSVTTNTPKVRRISCVDDNKDAANSLGMMLRFLGADIHIAYDGASALEAIKIFRPSIILMDLGVPEMDGCEVARRIRQDPEYQHLRLIALTGWGQAEDRLRSSAAGFEHHLVKPVDLSSLQALLAAVD